MQKKEYKRYREVISNNGDWIKIAREVLIDHCDGVHIITNTYYETANYILKQLRAKPNVIFYTLIIKPKGRK
jgi:HJR/Mrr/RecB family endonuclease